MSEAWERPIYRDRHGRGERGVLTGIWRPQYRKRSAIFDALAVGQLKRLRTAWPDMINSIQFAVTDTAPTDPLPWEDQQALRSLAYPAEHGKPARIMLFRRPLLNRQLSQTPIPHRPAAQILTISTSNNPQILYVGTQFQKR